MSICRWSGDSDVYMYFSCHGGIECCLCKLGLKPMFTVENAWEHLLAHKDAGDRVPDNAFTLLREEMKRIKR